MKHSDLVAVTLLTCLCTLAAASGYSRSVVDFDKISQPKNYFSGYPVFISEDSIPDIRIQSVSNRITINWKTDAGTGGGVFTVERSVDGESFLPIGSVSTGKVSSYFYEDINPVNGQNFYRITFLGANLQPVFSKTVMTTFTSGEAMKAYYINGGRLRLTLDVNVAGEFQVAVVNYMGQAVYKGEVSYPGIKNTFDINMNTRLNNGIYAIMISGHNLKISRQILVK